MILSVSRRTDIPACYPDWFFERLKEGFVYVRNPMNPHQLSRIALSPEVVDCIVFWTKNPAPMLARMEELSAYRYYFQFTLTGYGRDIERNVPHKREVMLPVFQRLSGQIGSRRVLWRYDPVLFTKTYTPEYHRKAFRQIAEALCGYTQKCIISFVDSYAKNKKNIQAAGVYGLPQVELEDFARELCGIAKENGMELASCAEAMDLTHCGIAHNCCIDQGLIEELTGSSIRVSKDKNQREACGCVESVDIGAYDTCPNGCIYCYASRGPEYVQRNREKYEMHSPLLCGIVEEGDRITERKAASLRHTR